MVLKNVINNKCLNDFTIFHRNICTSKNMDKFHELFQDCSKLPDIIGVTETRLKGNNIASDIPDYKFAHEPSYSDAGGTGIYISNSLKEVPKAMTFFSLSSMLLPLLLLKNGIRDRQRITDAALPLTTSLQPSKLSYICIKLISNLVISDHFFIFFSNM